MKRTILFLIIVVAAIVGLPAVADSALHQKLLKMSSEELLSRGRASQNPEEALLCFSIITDRIPEPSNKEEASLAP